MKILTNKGALRLEITPGDGSKWRKELMNEEYISIKISLKDHLRLRKGDHVSIKDVGNFEIVKTSRPKWNTSKGCWDYEQKFHAEWEKWKNRKFFFNRQSGNLEKSWSLTQYITYFLDLFIDNLKNAGLGDDWSYTIHDTELLSTIKNITFDGVSLFDGLTSITQMWGTEWWAEGRSIHIGKCEFGKAVRFEIGGYVTDMSASDSEGEYANRLYAFGSTRNIPKNYRGEQSQTAIDGVVQKRLQLPAGTNYVDAWPNMDNDDVVEGVVIFDDVYPRRVGTIYQVHTKEYTDKIEQEDGTTTEQKWNAYRFKDAGLQFSKEYMIDGEELRVVFQSGLLAGCDFAVSFNPDGTKEDLPTAQLFEIIRNEDYGIALPNDTLKPQDGDTYVLYGFDTKFVGDTYTPAAERELLDKAIDKVMTMAKDDNTYSCPTDPVACAGYYIDSNKGQLFDASRIVDLDVGQTVLLVNETYFGNDNRESRVRAFEKDLNNIYKCTYECGQSPRYSYFTKKEENVSTVTYNGKTYVSIGGNAGGIGSGGSNIYVLKRYDNVAATDYNVFSAARSLAEFLSKQRDDTAAGHITFNKGITSKDIAKLLGGALFGQFIEGLSGGKIDKDGNAELNELIVRTKALLNELRVKGVAEFDGDLFSRDFVSGFVSGRGWGITQETVKNALGVDETKYTGEFDNLVIRGAMRIFTLVVSQLLGENDNRIFTAMLEVDHYDAMTGRVYLKTQNGKLYNPFRVGDYIMVQQYNGMPSEANKHYITKHYECIITAVGVGDVSEAEDRLDWVEFKNFIAPDGGTPLSLIKEGDTFCRVDNETDADRKGIIQIMTVGSATPYMDISYGLKTNPDEALKGRIGNLSGIYSPLFGQLQGFGELLINLYAVGDFRIKRTGESVDAELKMLKGLFSTQFQKQTYELTEDDNYLTNATFNENMEGWTADTDENTKILSYTNGAPIVLNGSVISTGLHRANVEECDGKMMMHLQDTGIKQANSLIRKPGTHMEYTLPAAGAETTDTTGKEVQDKLYLSIKLLPKTAGKLTIGFKHTGIVPARKTNTLPYVVDMNIAKSQEWQTLQWEGTWHGLGDFYLRYTGEMYVSILSVTDRPLDEFKSSVSTQILQTAENVRIIGTNINAVKGSVTQLGIELRAADKEIRLYVDTTTSDLERRLGIIISDTEAAVKLYAEQYAKSYTDGELKNYYTKSEINVTVNGINQSVIGINNNLTQITSDINSLQGQIDTANAAIKANKTATDNLHSYLDGAFADGIVSEAEKIAIEKYLKTIEGTKKELDAAYSEVIGNSYLSGSTEYSNLSVANSLLAIAYTALVNTINSAIADGKATTEEISKVNSVFDTFNNCVSTLSTRIKEAEEYIRQKIAEGAEERAKAKAKELADEAALGEYYNQSTNPWQGWSSGSEWRHIGCKWKAQSSGTQYLTPLSTGGYTTKTTIAGKLYRFIGGSNGNENVWEEIEDAAISVSYISQTKSHISAVVANFDANGNVTSASGIATTAEGNRLWASKSEFNADHGKLNTVESNLSVLSNKVAIISTNFNADGSVNEESGIITTALGNTLYASRGTGAANLMPGASTGEGWNYSVGSYTENNVEYSGGYCTMPTENADRLYTFLLAARYTGTISKSNGVVTNPSQYSDGILYSPIISVEGNKKYTVSFNLYMSGTNSSDWSEYKTNYTKYAGKGDYDNYGNFKENYIGSDGYWYTFSRSNGAYTKTSDRGIPQYVRSWFQIYGGSASSIPLSTDYLIKDIGSQLYIDTERLAEHDEGFHLRYKLTFSTVNRTWTYCRYIRFLFHNRQYAYNERSYGYLSIGNIMLQIGENASMFNLAQAKNESLIKQTADSLTLSADRIEFIGKTTINGNFVVDTDGNVTMKNTTINGNLNVGGSGFKLFVGTSSSNAVINGLDENGNNIFAITVGYDNFNNFGSKIYLDGINGDSYLSKRAIFLQTPAHNSTNKSTMRANVGSDFAELMCQSHHATAGFMSIRALAYPRKGYSTIESNSWQTKRDKVDYGQVYLDGENVKVKRLYNNDNDFNSIKT